MLHNIHFLYFLKKFVAEIEQKYFKFFIPSLSNINNSNSTLNEVSSIFRRTLLIKQSGFSKR